MKSFSATIRAMIIGVITLLLFTATLVWAAPGTLLNQTGPEQQRLGYDPLSQLEQDLVTGIAMQNSTVSARLTGNERSELLLVERHRESKEAGRQADVSRRADLYLYLYDSDNLIHTIVNLENEEVDSVEVYQNVQLPLTANEISLAIQILLANAAFSEAMTTEYQAITGAALDRPSEQLKFHALVFWADSMPDKASATASACGLRRCAQLLIATADDTLINLLPIVDLSRRQLVSANSFLEE